MLIHDFDQLLNIEIDDQTFFLLKNLRIELNNSDKQFVDKLYNIRIKPFAIYVENLKHRFIIDSHQIREILDNIFPEFVDYQLVINGNNIANNSDSNKNAFIINREHKLQENIALLLNLGIKKDSNFYIKGMNQLLISSSIIAFSTSFLILYFYLKRKADNECKLYILEENLTTIDKERNALLNRDKIYNQLNKNFIKKATEIYIQQITGEKQGPENSVNISSKHYIFPMPLNDSSYSNVDIQNLVLMLKKYFSPYASNIALRVETLVNTISINCAPEVCYQLIFSLIYNLMELMEKQNEQQKLMKIEFSEKGIVVEYDSFPLDEARMIYLSDSIIEEHIDAFFLSCRKLLKSLIDHRFSYVIKSHDNGQNSIIISYPEKNLSTQTQENKVIDFSTYHKK